MPLRLQALSQEDRVKNVQPAFLNHPCQSHNPRQQAAEASSAGHSIILSCYTVPAHWIGLSAVGSLDSTE
jgi:hypothetical protein